MYLAKPSTKGTWCHHAPDNRTIIRKLDDLMIKDKRQIPRYHEGIGTSYSLTERLVGGMSAFFCLSWLCQPGKPRIVTRYD